MFYKMYRNRYLTGKKLDEETMKSIYTGFQEIYERHGVKVIGAWENAADTSETYLIAAYKDRAHFKDTVAKMREDPQYKKLSKTFVGTRELVEAVTLNLLPSSPE
jgi:hypothetical protein